MNNQITPALEDDLENIGNLSNEERVEMKLKTIFTINCVIGFLFGAGFTLLPELCCSLMGFNVAGDSSLIARGMGIFVFGTGVLTFFARQTKKSEARRAIVLSLFTLYILLILYKVSLNVLYGIPFNLMFAIIYIIHVGLVASYGYFLFGEPKEIESQPALSITNT